MSNRVNRCRWRRCILDGNPILCREHWQELCVKAEDLIADSDAFYIGRSRRPTTRCKDHLENKDLPKWKHVYEAATVADAMAVEEGLIGRFSHDPRCLNKSPNSDGRFREGRNYVYVAYSTRPGRSP